MMDDGGQIIEKLLSGNIEDENKNLAEAGFSRLYQETTALGKEEVISKYENKDKCSS